MTTKALCGVVAAVIGVAFACALGSAVIVGGVAAACTVAGPGGTPGLVVPSNSWQAIPESPEQCVSTCPQADWSSEAAGCMAGEAVLARAAMWLTAWNGGPVPYLSSTDPATWFQGCRRDCSGYASMALGLPGPGLDTSTLAARATLILKADLSAGDLLIIQLPTSPAMWSSSISGLTPMPGR